MKNTISIFFIGLFLIFAIQNITTIDVRFFNLRTPQVPLFAIIITSFILGMIFGKISGWLGRVSVNKKEPRIKNNSKNKNNQSDETRGN